MKIFYIKLTNQRCTQSDPSRMILNDTIKKEIKNIIKLRIRIYYFRKLNIQVKI